MNRKEFLNKLMKSGASLGCCGVLFSLQKLIGQETAGLESDSITSSWIANHEKKMIKGSESPDWLKYEKSGQWIKWLVDELDKQLDEPNRKSLLNACGRACHNHAFGVASNKKATPEQANNILKFLEDGGYQISKDNGITTIIYNWGRDHQNPWGLIMNDGYCMCPIVETGPKDLSSTFCNCSAGYVGEMFERWLGKAVKVEVMESLKSGGNDCIFKIEVKFS
ncbi:MAG: DUF6144 family protein [Candidatus Zixiibacteriota bacterium]